ncbi:MAG: DNA translocase FtsK [Leptospiraceae bacterium]|nr:DNA translocase FtsK [Leptospiraceae bacterium]
MFSWRKSSEKQQKQASTGVTRPTAGLVRPPWIQKITAEVPATQSAAVNAGTTQTTETEWKSRLAEKLSSLKETVQVPSAHVAGNTTGKDFAFHLAPLDAGRSIPTDPEYSVPQQREAPRSEWRSMPAMDVADEARNFQYIVSEEKKPTVTAGSYELSHSTVAYERGEDFNLEELFDEAGSVATRPWHPPDEAIDELLGDTPSADEENPPFASAATINKPSDDEQVEEGDDAGEQSQAVSAQSATVAKAVARSREKTVNLPRATQIGERSFAAADRASVTPVVSVNKQREILFPLLKTQKRALEFANPAEAQHVIEKLEETLEQFSIEGHVVGIQRGPIITRYELKMAAGIKVNRILALTDELAMALEAMRVRIEAPIPGRSTVGIEIPNKQRIKVLLGDILGDIGFREFGGELPLPLGRDIAGNLLLEDLTRMPHLLIAGATGSGKSVAVNSFISSLILNKTPEEVRFLLVDPKLVELSAYNDIPHLLHPVITEANKAILALNWAVEEMERRYEDLADMRARDIRSYNEKVRSQKANPSAGRARAGAAVDGGDGQDTPIMPYIVVLIDELGDLMMVAGKEVESSIIRLAQKARAVGIHLILATQRPSVDVITALIKANCPARIALQVAQKTDSRTILDGNGAEQLLGQGDMLFRHPSKAQLIRAQVPLIMDEEVEDVVTYAKKLAKPIYITLEDPKGKMGELEAGDEELFEEAWQIIVESQKASASYLQRRLRIGYNKAARLIEAFEARGMIGPQIGSKPREIISGTGQGIDRPHL